jgi:hypothetical protein
MRGIVLAYDRESGTGLIRAEDGSRYGFRAPDWRERTMPIKGVYVDFEAAGPLARDIYVMMPPDDGRDSEPVSFVAAMRTWISNHPEALVAALILIACALPFYRFLGIETTLFQAPEILLRLTSGLERIRALAQQVPSAATAAAIIKMLLPGLYVLWLIPLLAVWVLYRALLDLPRLGLLRLFGAVAVLLPVLVPLMVVVPTWFLVVSAIPDDQQVTLAYSVFDLPRFGPLRELALGAVATMVLGLGLFLWSINPDNVDERAARRQGTTHRHGRPGDRAPRGEGQTHQTGGAESFAPPRLRNRPDPQMPQMHPAGGGPQAGPAPQRLGASGHPNGPPHQQPHPGQPSHSGMNPGVQAGANPHGVQGAGQPQHPHPPHPQHPAQHPAQGQPQGQPQSQPRHAPPFPVEEGAPHHDPIPESLRRRFEERNQGQGQGQSGAQAGPAQPPAASPQSVPPGAPLQLPPPDSAPSAQPDHDPFAERGPSEAQPQRAGTQQPAPLPGLPDARDGTGMPADVQISGWSVNPGAPRYDFEALNPPGKTSSAPSRAAQREAPRDELADSPYAALARQLGLDDAAARKLAESHTAPIKPRDPGPQANPQAKSDSPRDGAFGGPARATPSAPQLQPPIEESTARPAQPPGPLPAPQPHRRQPAPPPPPPPDEVTEFLRALNEPDGLRKLAQSAPSFTEEPSQKSSDASRPPNRSRSEADDVLRAPSAERPGGSGSAVPPPSAPNSSGPLDSALDRAMNRLNGPGSDDGASKKAADDKPADEPDSVTKLYEKLRREREARDTKPTIPIPPVPPRR